jgi:apolipoprotein N-acyltransferase
VESDTSQTPGYFNTVMLIEKHGRCDAKYHKRLLVPFAEYLPYEREFPFLRRYFTYALTYTQGKASEVMDIGTARKIIPCLCYEAIFTDMIRDGARLGGNIIVNMVDDAWFGDNDSSLIHVSLAFFRAVEYRMPYVRVTNSGVGVFVRATGEIVQDSMTPLFKTATSVHTLYIPQNRPLYFYVGDAFLYLALLGLLSGLTVKMFLARYILRQQLTTPDVKLAQ